MSASPLQTRSDELGLDKEQAAGWQDRVSPELVEAVLANLIRFEDALRELSQ